MDKENVIHTGDSHKGINDKVEGFKNINMSVPFFTSDGGPGNNFCSLESIQASSFEDDRMQVDALSDETAKLGITSKVEKELTTMVTIGFDESKILK